MSVSPFRLESAPCRYCLESMMLQVILSSRSLFSVGNLSDYPTKVGFRIFCRISSDYEEYARSLLDFNIFDHITLKQS